MSAVLPARAAAAPTRLQRVRERTGLDTIELMFLLSRAPCTG